ncbi:MAG: UDP-N-acetylmuramoyl-L-alanine--D-glutamate ligase [Planctomycetaceae bacterium]|nr:UDP-N-acetylmuramoyl-L-alanine--D-glutamate ligase [Planctomycetaceae bacterium]
MERSPSEDKSRLPADTALPPFAGLRVTVLGLGQFGGGVGAVQFLLDRGAEVTVTDLRPQEQLSESLAKIRIDRLCGLHLGKHREQDFTDAELIVVNPAVPPGNRYVMLAHQAGVPLTSEIALFWEQARCRKLVVTGTVGKSSTTTLIHRCLIAAGVPAYLGGNIGVSLLPVVDEIPSEGWAVLELSSFQLSDLSRLSPQPDVAVVTNFHPNHLDWHRDLAEYRWAKRSALRWQRSDQVAVLPGDGDEAGHWWTDANRCWFGNGPLPSGDQVQILEEGFLIASKGLQQRISIESCSADLRMPHQRRNVAAAIAAVRQVLGGFPDESITALKDFRALPHRFERVGEVVGRTLINDSKSTTPEAAIAALKCCSGAVWLICGGRDKGVDLSEFAAAIRDHAHGVALMGETAPELGRLLSESKQLVVERHPGLEEAVDWCISGAETGAIILLSPGCASDAPFANYEERGNRFRAIAAKRAETAR